MNANKFTQKSLEAVTNAQQLALENQNMQIEEAHLLLSLCQQEQGLISELLKKQQTDVTSFINETENIVKAIPSVSGPGREMGKIYVSPDVDSVLNEAEKRAQKMNDEYVSVEHIFLALIQKADANLSKLFKKFNIIRFIFFYVL